MLFGMQREHPSGDLPQSVVLTSAVGRAASVCIPRQLSRQRAADAETRTLVEDNAHMVYNTPIALLIDFLEGDFECAWDAVAGTPVTGAVNRGNFMFARQAMGYLELACRLCEADQGSLRDLSSELAGRDARYFSKLPGNCRTPKDFCLPTLSGDSSHELIGLLFDMVRNGQAHQYQQINAELSDGVEFFIGLSGAEQGLFIAKTFLSGRPSDHLKSGKLPSGKMYLNIRTDVLWHDLRDSVRAARLAERGLMFEYLERKYPFSSNALQAVFDGWAPA